MRSLDYVYEGTSEEFVSTLTEEVLQHPAVNHEYLVKLSEGTFKDSTLALRDYAHQYSFYSMLFPDYVKAIMATTDDEIVLEPLEENLLEELGEPDGEHELVDARPHTEIFREFKTNIGIDESYKKDNPMSLTVAIWRDLFLQKCKSENTAIGVGAISLATEFIVPHFYPYIINCIENHTDYGKDESYFFRLHVECDEQHAQDAIEVVKYMAETDQGNREALRFGVVSALNLRQTFWDNQLARANAL